MGDEVGNEGFCETSVPIYWTIQYHITFYSHNELPAWQDGKNSHLNMRTTFLSLFILLITLFIPSITLLFKNTVVNFYEVSADKTDVLNVLNSTKI